VTINTESLLCLCS